MLATLAALVVVPLIATSSHAATFVVNSTGDAPDADTTDGSCETATVDECTLRAAIEQANATTGPHQIHFDIPGAGPHSIQPNTQLPTIDEPMTIDGYTQPGASPNTLAAGSDAVLLVELDGQNTGAGIDGLTVGTDGAGSTIRGLVINDFDGSGVRLLGNDTVVEGNLIGTDPTGTLAVPNGEHGVRIDAAADNTVGGTTPSARNLISGNTQRGIHIGGTAATGNLVQGNFIGTDVAGDAALGNGFSGVSVAGGSNNTIGGTGGAGNVVSGNGQDGLVINLASATGNVVQANRIGTNAAGDAAVPNAASGIFIGGASDNQIGGTGPGEGNVISGNDGSGVVISGVDATGNIVEGNNIGTDVAGDLDLGNGSHGIALFAPSNTIGGPQAEAGNLISGNAADGVRISTASATGNVLQGNRIGTNSPGDATLANGGQGVLLSSSPSNTIGGSQAGAGNLISGNAGGVLITGAGATGNVLQGNRIGTDAVGDATLANSGAGLFINSAPSNTIGGTEDGEGNLISGNTVDGVHITGAGATGNVLQGNRIGTNTAGDSPVPNGSHGVRVGITGSDNTIGGTQAGAGNLISGNAASGVLIIGVDATGNVLQGNRIGTNAEGDAALPNGSNGVDIASDAPGNLVGGTEAGAGNTIASNGGHGVSVRTDGATGNSILGNSIFDNAGLGIEIGTDGVTANDLQDADTGPNNFQNFPELTAAASKSTLVEGSLNSVPDTSFRLEFFSSPACDASGHGQGETLLGSTEVTTDVDGDAVFSETLAATAPVGDEVTATATRLDGVGVPTDTSEFSACVTVVEAPIECGDTVVGTVVLTEDLGPCPDNGLLVGGPDTTIDLNGHTITGTGGGFGIGIAPGTDASGAVVTGGAVNGFGRGIFLRASGVAKVIGTTVVGNATQGVQVVAGTAVVRGVTALHNGSQGIFARSDGRAVVKGNTAKRNDRQGIKATAGGKAVVTGNTTKVNKLGVQAKGDKVVFRANTANNNDRHGLQARADRTNVRNNTARGNGRLGIAAPDRPSTRGGDNLARGNNAGGRQCRPDRIC